MKTNQKISASTTKSMSYNELETLHLEYLFSKKTSKQEIKNIHSVHRSWRKALELNPNSPVGNELNKNFSQNLTEYRYKQIELYIQKSTYSSRISKIRKFQCFYMNTQKNELPARFNERLKQAIEKQGWGIHQFFKTCLENKICYNTFHNWINANTIPNQANYFIIKEIETTLNLIPKTLTSVLPKCPLQKDRSLSNKITYDKSPKNNKCQKYAVWTEAIAKEFQDLAEYKSSTILPENLKRSNTGVWTFNEKQELPTASYARRYLSRFFGYCHLSKNNSDSLLRGLSINEDDLTIALLTDKHVVERYITAFRKARSNQKFNDGHLSLIGFITCLLRKDTGYLYQKSEFAKKLNLNLSVREWQKRCLDTCNRLLEIKQAIKQAKKNGNSEYGVGRDPVVLIKQILKFKNPVSVTMQMTTNMLADIEKLYSKPVTQAILYRNVLIVTLLQANPLRARMLTIMEINKNLIKKPDGSWWIYFDRRNFKNRRFLTQDYFVKVAPSLWKMIETYLNDYRPILLGSHVSDIVFTNTATCGKVKTNLEMSVLGVANLIKRITKKYIPNSPGFRTHSFRHIVATTIIKNDIGTGFYLAAKVLNDKPETVENYYAHLKTNEMFEPYNEIFEKNWTDALTKDRNEDEPSNQEGR